MINTQIVHKNGHYEVYVNGEFICSADTVVEAARELDEYFEKNETYRSVERV